MTEAPDRDRDHDHDHEPDFTAESILSHGERDVARRLWANPDATPAEIADARGVDPEAVRKSIDRIREKTVYAVATLEQSPFAAAVAAEFDPDTRERIVEALTTENRPDD